VLFCCVVCVVVLLCCVLAIMQLANIEALATIAMVLGVGEPLIVDWNKVNLPEEHVPYYFHSHPELRDQCSLDNACPYRVSSYRFVI